MEMPASNLSPARTLYFMEYVPSGPYLSSPVLTPDLKVAVFLTAAGLEDGIPGRECDSRDTKYFRPDTKSRPKPSRTASSSNDNMSPVLSL